MVLKEQLLEELDNTPESRLDAVLEYLQMLQQPTVPGPSEELRSLFETLVQQWWSETRFMSSVRELLLD